MLDRKNAGFRPRANPGEDPLNHLNSLKFGDSENVLGMVGETLLDGGEKRSIKREPFGRRAYDHTSILSMKCAK